MGGLGCSALIPLVLSPHRCPEGSHRNDLPAAAQPHPPGKLPEAYRAAAWPDWGRQSHSTWQGKGLCLVLRAFAGFISKEVPLKWGFAITAPLVCVTSCNSLSECHGWWIIPLVIFWSEKLLLKLWLQFCVPSTDTGCAGVCCSVSDWELLCPAGNALPLLPGANPESTGMVRAQHWAELVWVPLCYWSLCSSCLDFCFFVFDRCTGHKYRSIAWALGMLWHSLQWDVSVIGELLVSNRNSAPFPSLPSLI